MFRPGVLQYKPLKELRWIGKLKVSHLFDGEHTFKLLDNGDGSVTFIQYERFRGLLISFFKKMLDKDTKEGFEAMNKKLREFAQLQ